MSDPLKIMDEIEQMRPEMVSSVVGEKWCALAAAIEALQSERDQILEAARDAVADEIIDKILAE